MRNLKINFISDTPETKYKMPNTPKGSNSMLTHFYKESCIKMIKFKLIKNYPKKNNLSININ